MRTRVPTAGEDRRAGQGPQAALTAAGIWELTVDEVEPLLAGKGRECTCPGMPVRRTNRIAHSARPDRHANSPVDQLSRRDGQQRLDDRHQPLRHDPRLRMVVTQRADEPAVTGSTAAARPSRDASGDDSTPYGRLRCAALCSWGCASRTGAPRLPVSSAIASDSWAQTPSEGARWPSTTTTRCSSATLTWRGPN